MAPDKIKKKEAKHNKNAGKEKIKPDAFQNLWIPLIAILSITFFILFPCLQNSLTNWDDPTYITDNPLIKQLSAANLKRIFTEVYFSNYQPLHIFAYSLEYHFFKDQPGGYHAVSLLLHLTNTSLVLWLVWLLTRNPKISVVTCALFGIHPLHVESIAWAAEHKDLLYALFFFLSLIFYVKYVQSAEKMNYLFAAFVFFILSVFSKTMAASLPPILVLMDYFFKRKLNLKIVLEKIPFFILALVMGVVSVNASHESGSIATTETFSLTDRFFFANHNLFNYFYKLVIPLKLSAYYPYPDKINGSLAWYYYCSPLLSAALVFACFYSIKFNRIILLCIGFFVITIFLVLQLLPVGPAIFSERYSYVPSLGFFMLLGIGFDKIITNPLKQLSSVKPVFWSIAVVYCVWLCTLTYHRCGIWKNSISLWDNVISQFDKALHAINNRADAYYKNGNYELAVKDLNKAIALDDNYAMAYYNRGNAYGQLGKFKEAFNDLDKAIKIDPKNADAYNKRGQANAVLGNKNAAFSDFNIAAELKPDNPEIYYNIGITWINNGNKEEACKALLKAVNMGSQPAMKAYGEICK